MTLIGSLTRAAIGTVSYRLAPVYTAGSYLRMALKDEGINPNAVPDRVFRAAAAEAVAVANEWKGTDQELIRFIEVLQRAAKALAVFIRTEGL